jgi:hypothetical protein
VLSGVEWCGNLVAQVWGERSTPIPSLLLPHSFLSLAMFSLLSALSKFVVTIIPFVALPFSLVFSVNLTLKISIIFLLYHLLVAAIRYGSKGIWVRICIPHCFVI